MSKRDDHRTPFRNDEQSRRCQLRELNRLVNDAYPTSVPKVREDSWTDIVPFWPKQRKAG